jgi:hypothetical protein
VSALGRTRSLGRDCGQLAVPTEPGKTTPGQDHPLEQHQTETEAIEALRAAAAGPIDEGSKLLRARLVERGRYESAAIEPPGCGALTAASDCVWC